MVANAVEYYSLFECVNCAATLTHYDRMYSHGRCRYCGHKNKSAGNVGTIVITREVCIRRTRINPWWKVWRPQFKTDRVTTEPKGAN